MRKISLSIIGTVAFISVALVGNVAAQSNCDAIRMEKGEGEYQACLRGEREDRANALVDVYRKQMDYQRKTREFTYEQRRQKAEILWKKADFNLERKIQDSEQRIALLRLSHGDDPEIRIQEVHIDALKQHRELQKNQKDRMIDLYNDRQSMELAYLEVQFQRYVLSVRGFSALNFEW
jgi:hypothetical protein